MSQKLRLTFISFGLNNKALIITIFLVIVFAITSPVFLTTHNILNVLRQISISAIVAAGFTLVLAGGEIDLSVGGMIGIIGILVAKSMDDLHLPIYIAIIIGLLVGASCGLFNGIIINKFSLPPFIVTLSTGLVFRGIVYVITSMTPVAPLPEAFNFIGQGYLLYIPLPVYILVFVTLIIYIIANHTAFGRHVIAMGGSKQAARLSGVRIEITRLLLYILVGICCAVAAIVLTGRTASGQVNAGFNMELDMIAAVVIGGTSLTGGNANVIGSIFGVLLIGLVSNGLNLLGVDPNWQVIAKGLLILIAIILDAATSGILRRILKR